MQLDNSSIVRHAPPSQVPQHQMYQFAPYPHQSMSHPGKTEYMGPTVHLSQAMPHDLQLPQFNHIGGSMQSPTVTGQYQAQDLNR